MTEFNQEFIERELRRFHAGVGRPHPEPDKTKYKLRKALMRLLECELYCQCGNGDVLDRFGETHAEICPIIEAERVLGLNKPISKERDDS